MPESPLALIVGASRGIGLGLTRELLGRGWHVIATARDPNAATDLAGLSASHPGALRIEKFDLDKTQEHEQLADRLGADKLDVLLVNAGVAGPAHRSAQAATAEEIGALMFTNAVAPIRLARVLLDHLREPSGVVAFMSSVMGSVAENTAGNHELYRASKAALNSLVRGFHGQLGARKITVLSLHPGWVRTDMGGPNAAIDVETSVKGLASVLERERGALANKFLDYTGTAITW